MLDIIAAEDDEAEMSGAGPNAGPNAGSPMAPPRGTAMVPVPGDGVRLPQTIKPAKMPAPPPESEPAILRMRAVITPHCHPREGGDPWSLILQDGGVRCS